MNTRTFSKAAKALFINDVRRFGKAALIGTILLLAAVFITSKGILMNGNDTNGLCAVLYVTSLIYPIAGALAVWRYLFSKKELAFMHSIPASRGSHFIGHALSGLVFSIIPLTAGIVLAEILVPSLETQELISTLLTLAGGTFSFCTLAAFLAGTSVMQLLLTFGLIAILPLTGMFLSFFGTYFLAGFESFTTMSSLAYMLYPAYGHVWIRDIVLSIIVLCLSYYLYKKRPLENTGSSYIFSKVSSLEIGIVSICLASFITIYSFWTEKQLLLEICIAFLVFILISLAVYGKKNVFRGKSLKAIGIFAGILLIITGSFAADIFGFEQKLPTADKIESVDLDISTYYAHNWGSDAYHYNVEERTSREMIEFALALNKELAAQAEPSGKGVTDGNESYIRYHMKSGATLVRKYSDSDIEKLKGSETLKNIYESYDFKRGLLLKKNKLFTGNTDSDDIEITVTSDISNNEKQIPSKYVVELINAIDADTLENSYEEQTSEEIIGVIRLEYTGNLQSGFYISTGNDKERYDEYITVPVRETDTNLIEYLKSINCCNLIKYSDCQLTEIKVFQYESSKEASISADELGIHTMDEYRDTYGFKYEHAGKYSVEFHIIDSTSGKEYEMNTSIRKKDAPSYFDKLEWVDSE